MTGRDAKPLSHLAVAELSLTDFGRLMQTKANLIAARMKSDQRH